MNKEEQSNRMSLEMMFRFYKVPAAAAVVVVVLLVLGWNQINGITEQWGKLGEYKQQIAALDKRLVVLKSQANGGLKQTKTVVIRALPEEKPVFEAFSALTSLAGETGVVLNQLSSSPGSLATASAGLTSGGGVSGVKSMQMKLSVEGEESAVKNYLSEMLRVVPLIDLNTVKLSSERVDENGPQKYKLELDLSVYWMPSFKSTSAPKETPELTPEQEQVVQDLLEYKYYGIN